MDNRQDENGFNESDLEFILSQAEEYKKQLDTYEKKGNVRRNNDDFNDEFFLDPVFETAGEEKSVALKSVPEAMSSPVAENNSETETEDVFAPKTSLRSFEQSEEADRRVSVGFSLEAVAKFFAKKAPEAKLSTTSADEDVMIDAASTAFVNETKNSAFAVSVRFWSVLVLFLFSVYITALAPLGIPVPQIISPQHAPQAFLIVNLLIVIMLFAFGITIYKNGIMNIVTAPSSETGAVICWFFVFLSSLISLICSYIAENADISQFTSCAALALLMCAYEEKIKYRHELFLSEIAASEGKLFELYSADGSISDIKKSQKLYFLGHCESGYNEKAPMLVLGFGVVIVAGLLLVTKSGDIILKGISAVAAAVAVFNGVRTLMPMQINLSRSKDEGFFFPDEKSAEDLASCEKIAIESGFIFTSSNIKITGLNVYNKNRIDVTIMIVSALMNKLGNSFAPLFLNIVGGKKILLPKLNRIEVFEGMGYKTECDGSSYIVGTPEFLQNENIAFERRLPICADGEDLIAVAENGELSMVFQISSSPLPEACDHIAFLASLGVETVVLRSDPFISDTTIVSELEKADVKCRVASPEEASRQRKLRNEKENVEYLALVDEPTVKCVSDAVSASKKLMSASRVNFVVQIIFAVIILFCILLSAWMPFLLTPFFIVLMCVLPIVVQFINSFIGVAYLY